MSLIKAENFSLEEGEGEEEVQVELEFAVSQLPLVVK